MSATTATIGVPVGEHWHELVTVALLGTDRREPRAPPPGAVADVDTSFVSAA